MMDVQEDDSTLKSFFEQISKGQPQSPYNQFGFLSNPFPAAGQFMPDICVDQEAVKKDFAHKLREFYLDGRSQRMLIEGQTGAGKTNILRFIEQSIKEWRTPEPGFNPISDLYTIYIHKSKGSYLEVHRQILFQLGAMFYTEFFAAVRGKKINLDTLPVELSGISPELVRVLRHISSHRRPVQLSFAGPNVESLRTMDDWLQGVKLTPSQKKELGGVTVEIGKSTTTAVKLLTDLIRIFKHANLFKGLIVLFDEFEEIASKSLAESERSRYAQDMRNLFDSLSEGILFIIATVPILDVIEGFSPALRRRLGQATQIRLIDNEELALRYADAYIGKGRALFRDKMDREAVPPEDCEEEDRAFYPLSRKDIIEVYEEFRKSIGKVPPGDFLPELNLRVYQLAYGES